MKTIKGLILGSAAGLLAAGGAQAADLPRKGQSGRVREDLLPVWCRILLHSGHRHLHQAGWLSARRHHVQRRHLRPARPGMATRSGRSLQELLLDPFASGASRSTPVPRRNTASSAPSVRPTSSSTRWATTRSIRTPWPPTSATTPTCSAAPAAAMLRPKWVSSSSPALPSVARRPPLPRLGKVTRATTPRS